MAEILELADHPLASGQARQLENAVLTPGGIVMDRVLVAYRPNRGGDLVRIGQKDIRGLAQFSVDTDFRAGHQLLRIYHGESEDYEIGLSAEDQGSLRIDEFKDSVPIIPQPDEAANWMCERLGLDTGSFKLGQKPLSWQRGVGRDPAVSRLAPLHIVTAQTVEHAKELVMASGKVTQAQSDLIGADRLRANMVINAPNFTPLIERLITGITVGGKLRLLKVRDTERCPIPGNDQKTGDKMSDLVHAYPALPKSAGHAVLGAYFVPILEPGEEAIVSKGDKVEFMFD